MVQSKLMSKQYSTFDTSKFKSTRKLKVLTRELVDRMVEQKDMELYHMATKKRTEFLGAATNYVIRAQAFFSELEAVLMKAGGSRSNGDAKKATKLWRHWLDRADM